MKKIILPCLLMVLILFTKDIQASDDLTNKILQLEQNFSKLQQQINQLRKDMGSKKVSKTNSQRLANLEAYAVQLNDVLSEVKEQIEENTDEVARISKIQQTKPNIGVYGTITAAKAENQNSIIDGQSFELVISGQPHKRISYFTELEFERAATVGGSRGGEVLLEQAYTDFQVNSWLNFRGGILLVPFGNIERDHYAPLREVISKPLTSTAIAPSDWTDNGFGFNGRFNIAKNWIADYQAYVIAGLGSDINTTGLRASRQGFGADNNNNKAFAGKLSLQNTSGITLGLSYYTGAWNDSGDKDISGFNIDFDYQWKSFEFIGEYTDMDIQRELGSDAHMDGFYLRSIYTLDKIFPEDWFAGDFPNAKLSFVAQFDQVTIENFFDPAQADNWEERLTLGLRLQPTSSWILSLNYENARARGAETILRGNDDLWIFSLGYVF